MNPEIRVNTTPINPGDNVTIAFLPDASDLALTLWYSVELSFNGGATFPRTLAPNVSPLEGGEYHWNGIDVIGATLRIRVTGHRAGPSVSAFTPVFAVVPLSPQVTDPLEEQTLALGGTWTVRWAQPDPEPNADSYAISYRPSDDQPFQVLRQGIAGSARSAAVTIPGPVTQDGVLRVEGRYQDFPPRRDNVSVNVVDHPVVKVTRPTRASVWFLGDEGTIAWLASGAITTFTLDLSRNNGSTWTTLFSSLGSSQRQAVWGVDPPVGSQCKVRVTARWTGGQISALSPPFRIRVNPVDP